MRGAPRSLAGALYRRVVLAVAVAALAMIATVMTAASITIGREADAQLLTAANVLLALMQDELGERKVTAAARPPIQVGDDLLSDEDARAFHRSADWRMFVIFANGRPILLSDTAPPVAAVPRIAGFHDFRTAKGMWRSYGLQVPEHRLLLVVGERLSARHSVLWDIALRLVIPFAALLPLAAFLLHLSLRSGLRSLRRLSEDLSRRSPQDLERLDVSAWPRDLGALLVALNRLLARLGDAFAREQSFTDDAAHQLRTPLAAIRIQAQTVAAGLGPADRASGARLLAGVDRATALVDHMLVLARLEATAIVPKPFDVAACVADIIADQAGPAAQREVEFAFVAEAAPAITSDPAVLAVALAAICENAVKHSPAGGQVLVSIAADGATGASVTVSDQGPGIAPADRARLCERFARGREAQGGAGLGLAIARRAIGLLRGDLQFADAAPDAAFPGLVVRLTLPTLPEPVGGA